MGEIHALFRLLSDDTRERYLDNFKFKVEHWVQSVTAYRLERATRSGHYCGRDLVGGLFQLPVWSNRDLLSRFVKCEYSAVDWSLLSIDKFVNPSDPKVYWLDCPTFEGRQALVRAVRNLELMCQVNFDPLFEGAFQSLVELLERSSLGVSQCYDIYLRFRVDCLLVDFFGDVRGRRRSLVFGEQSTRTPEDCVQLLQLYIGSLREVLERPDVFSVQEQWLYGESGARLILMDAETLARLVTPQARIMWRRYDSTALAGVDGDGQGRSKRTRAEMESSEVRGARKPGPCVWFLLSKLGVKKMKSGVVYNCYRPDCAFQHLPPASFTLDAALGLLDSVKWSGELRKYVHESVKGNASLFKA